MGKKILILDDDVDFNNLLTDIFIQADYDVTSERDPLEALRLFQMTHFDLVVTDQKMPGLSGEQFIRKIKQMRPEVPVIMVSGYLDNDTIRSLIKEGVGGVFLKPLNVFSLIKRTAALIEEAEAGGLRKIGKRTTDIEDYQHSLPFPFKTFPCKSLKALEFAQKLYSLRNFKSTLVFIGEEGMDFRGILSDIEQFHHQDGERCLLLEHSSLNEAEVLRQLDRLHKEGAHRITLAVYRPELLNEERLDLLQQIYHKRGNFEHDATPVRMIFILNEDIDVLYERGAITDELYMFMGTSEIHVPSLRELKDDIPILFKRALESALSELAKTGKGIDMSAISFLREYEWKGNMSELRKVAKTVSKVAADKVISREDLEKAIKAVQEEEGGAAQLRLKLEVVRDDYVRALYLLLGRDRKRLSSLLHTPQELIDKLTADFG